MELTSNGSGTSLAAKTSTSDKYHPSESLEFITIAPQMTHISDEIALSDGYDHEERTASDQLGQFSRISRTVPGLRHFAAGARSATNKERKMTFLGGCRLYPKAIAWSIVLSSALIMEGFDTALIYSFYTFPAFKRIYGSPSGNGSNEISASWQSSLPIGTVVGEIVGLFLNGYLSDRIGYKRTMAAALVVLSLTVFLAFFAVNMQMVLASQILCGVPWGFFQTLSTTYAAEVMPVTLRAYLLSNINLCWVLGQLTSVGILRSLINSDTQWSYRIPFALQWAFALPLLVAVLFAPESPWWLVRQGKSTEAREALLRLTTKGKGDFNVDETIAMMKHTNELEKYLRNDSMSYWECFKGVDLRRTEVAGMAYVTQQFCGSSLTGWAAYFYEQAGFNVEHSFSLTVGVYAMAVLGAICSWVLLPRVGRRCLYLSGLLAMIIILVVAGSVGAAQASRGQLWALGSLLLALTFVYDLTLGPVCYVLVGEVPSTRLRIKTVVLARVAYNITGIATNLITPLMLNPTAWGWKGKSCYFYAATATLCFAWCYWRLPDTFGLSYLEIDLLFEKKAKASKFRELQINLDSWGYFSIEDERRPSAFQGY